MSTDPIVVSAAEGGDRSRVKKLLVVAAVVFTATLVWPRISGGGGGDDFEDFPVVAAPAPAPSMAPAAPVGDARLIGASRDPFRALVSPASATGRVAPSPAAAPAPAIESVQAPLPVLPPFPVTVAQPAPPPAPVTTPVPTTPTTVAAPKPTTTTTTTTVDPRSLRRFSLLAVTTSGGKKTARIAIDDATLQVVEGERFWADYRVVSLDTDAMCGVFEYRGKAFGLCHGETTRT